MRPEQQIQQASRPARHADMPRRAPIRLDDVAVRLMAVQRHWNDADRSVRLSAALQSSRAAWHAIQSALAEGELALPPDVQHNLLILSVYAEHKIAACESAPSVDALGGLIALTHNLAGSLSEWREAA